MAHAMIQGMHTDRSLSRTNSGFTLVEMLLVVAVIAILTAVIYPSFGSSQAQGRDAQRQTDLRTLQIEIENYKRKEGRYPESAVSSGWSTQAAHGTAFIDGLFPEYVATMPQDPLPGTQPGYAYQVNSDGTVYKLMAQRTVESVTVTPDHALAPCSEDLCTGSDSCDDTSAAYQTSFAVWGGFANAADTATVRDETADIVCDL